MPASRSFGHFSARAPMKRQGHGLGDGLRLPALDGAIEVDRRHAEIAAAGGEQLAHELVVGHVLPDARCESSGDRPAPRWARG